jgi:hypothetical protein
LTTSRPLLAWRASLATAALALAACLATVFVAIFSPGGHPPPSAYVGSIAVPLAWLLALCGISLAVVSRHSIPRRRFVMALAGNLVALLAGFGLWFL